MFNPIEINAAARKTAKLLGESGGAGRAENGKITFDGDTTGKEVVSVTEGSFVAITDKPMDLTSVSRIVLTNEGGKTMEVTKAQISATSEKLSASIGEASPVLLFSADYVYAFCDQGMYVSLVETETIHPIDPKYLPGVCLPLLELSTEPTTEGAELTEEEVAAINALNGAPCILQFKFTAAADTVSFKAYGSATLLSDGTLYSYETPALLIGSVAIINENGWKFYIG